MTFDYFAVHPIRIATIFHDLGVQQWALEQRMLAKLALDGQSAIKPPVAPKPVEPKLGSEVVTSEIASPAPVRAVPRKSKPVVADVVEGDSVAVLEEHRDSYSDILAADKQVALKVVKKYPGRGGGLLVAASSGTKLKVAASHVRLEEAA